MYGLGRCLAPPLPDIAFEKVSFSRDLFQGDFFQVFFPRDLFQGAKVSLFQGGSVLYCVSFYRYQCLALGVLSHKNLQISKIKKINIIKKINTRY